MTSLPASNAEEPVALKGTSISGPNIGLQDTDMAGPISGGERMSVASAGAGSMEMGIGDPRSYISEETGSVLEDIPGIGSEKTTAETTPETTVDSTQRTCQEILGGFAEDWLKTLDKDEIKFKSFIFMSSICVCVFLY